MLLVYDTTYSMITIPVDSLFPELYTSVEERAEVNTIRQILAAVGLIFSALVPGIFIGELDQIDGYLLNGIVTTIIVAVSMVIFIKWGALEKEEFKMTAYCTLLCDQCDAYIASKNNDSKLKSKVAENWRMEPDKIYCEGCRSKKALFNCSAKKCAIEKKKITCAHCEDFPTCDNKIWKNQPQLRQNAEAFRKKLKR